VATLLRVETVVARGVKPDVLVAAGFAVAVFEEVFAGVTGFFVVWAEAGRADAPMSSVAVTPTTDK
jgi:hypothetical protein